LANVNVDAVKAMALTLMNINIEGAILRQEILVAFGKRVFGDAIATEALDRPQSLNVGDESPFIERCPRHLGQLTV
jgi:hypothetical protein